VTLAVIDKLLNDPYGTVPIRPKDADWDAVAARGEMPRGGVELRVSTTIRRTGLFRNRRGDH
jgi:hypothetical protein